MTEQGICFITFNPPREKFMIFRTLNNEESVFYFFRLEMAIFWRELQ
jgi:hypothetical protein